MGEREMHTLFDRKPETNHVTGLGIGGVIKINMHLEGIE
jgi:hypothetical protein